jgi:hypothetical protein
MIKPGAFKIGISRMQNTCAQWTIKRADQARLIKNDFDATNRNIICRAQKYN